MEFVKTFWKNKFKDADIPKISISCELLLKLVVVHAGCVVSFFKMFCWRCQALSENITAQGSVWKPL